MDMTHEWCEPLIECAEGLYIIEEDTYRLMWASDYTVKNIGTPYVGEPCWKMLFNREQPCTFCPKLTKEDGVYAWDNYDFQNTRWTNIKHLVFERDGVLYRAGNVNVIQDVMQLNYETVQEIAELQNILRKNKGEKLALEKEETSEAMTNLLNRNGFQLELEREYKVAQGLGMLYMDLNNLKEINDHYEHAMGDQILCTVAEAMRQCTKRLNHAKCYRMGGDEFVIVLTDCKESDLVECEERFSNFLNNYNQVAPIKCKVAVGRAFSKCACDPMVLMSVADHNMYRMKQRMKSGGKNRSTD